MLSASHVLGSIERLERPALPRAKGWPSSPQASPGSSAHSSPNSSVHGETHFAADADALKPSAQRKIVRGDSASSMHGVPVTALPAEKSEAGLITGDFLMRASMTRSSVNRIPSLPTINEHTTYLAELKALFEQHAATVAAGALPTTLTLEKVRQLAGAVAALPTADRAGYLHALIAHAPAESVVEPAIARALHAVPEVDRSTVYQQLRAIAPSDPATVASGGNALTAERGAHFQAKFGDLRETSLLQQKQNPLFHLKPIADHRVIPGPAIEPKSFIALAQLQALLPPHEREASYLQLVFQAPPTREAYEALMHTLGLVPALESTTMGTNPRVRCYQMQRADLAHRYAHTMFHPSGAQLRAQLGDSAAAVMKQLDKIHDIRFAQAAITDATTAALLPEEYLLGKAPALPAYAIEHAAEPAPAAAAISPEEQFLLKQVRSFANLAVRFKAQKGQSTAGSGMRRNSTTILPSRSSPSLQISDHEMQRHLFKLSKHSMQIGSS